MGFLRSNSDSAEEQRPSARERARMRRRLRRQRQMREALLLDLGALVFELHRHGRREPELLQAKATELTAVDEEVRALAEALGSDQTVMQLVATGVAGSCENCGSLLSVDARYCSSCGAPAVPALSGDGERRAFGPDAPTDEYAALAAGIGPEQDREETQPEQAAAGEAAAETEAFGEGDAGEEVPVEEPAPDGGYPDDLASEEESLSEWGALENAATEETAEHEAIDEGVISVSRVRTTKPEAPPEDEEPEAEQAVEPELEEPEFEEDEGGEEGASEELETEEAEETEPEAEELEPEEDEEPEEPKPEAEPAQPEAPAAKMDGSDGRKAAADPRDHEHSGQAPRTMADDALDTAARAIRTGITRGREWIRGRRTED